MRKILAALVVLAVAALGALGVAAFVLLDRGTKSEDEVFGVPWAPYTPTVGHYTISFPRRPNESSTAASLPPVTYIAHYSIGDDEGPDEDYQVELTQLARVNDVEKELDAGIDDFLMRRSGWTLVSRSKITLNGKYPGRAATMKSTDSGTVVSTKLREYIVDDRRYVLFCSGVKNAADVDRFLDSFKLVK